MNRNKRQRKKVAQKGTENVKHLGKRYKEMRAMFFSMEEHRNELVGKEWQAIKRAMRAEAEVKKLRQQIEDMRNAPELLFPR